MKIQELLLIPLLSLLLFSCGNKEGEGEGNDMMQDGMMEDGMMEEGMMEDGMMSEEIRQAMMSEGMGPELMEDMRTIRKMLMNHEQIDRRVEDIDKGVKSWTTSEDPEIAAAIQKHVRQMHERIKEKKAYPADGPAF